MAWKDIARAEHPSQLGPLNLPARYTGLDPAGIQNAALRACTEHYLKHFWKLAAKGIAPGFFGRSGTHKTWAACCIADRVHTKGLVDSEYVQAGAEFSRLERRRFDPGTEERLAALVELPFLILDDITDVKPQSEAMAMLDAVVKARDAAGYPTLYTGNALFTAEKPDVLLQQFGAGLTRRILEGTKGTLVVIR